MRPVSLLLLVLIAGCAAPAPVTLPETEPVVEVGPSLDVLAVNDSGLVLERRPERGSAVVSDVQDAVQASLSPDGQYVAVWSTSPTASFVHVFDRQAGTARLAWEGAVGAVVSMAWAPHGDALFIGHRGSGTGGIERLPIPGTGPAVSVGCSASNMVLAVRPDGSLVVRGGDNIYVVAADGCATVRTVDARKLHHVTASPDGRHLAYILRDLVYNREKRTYEPDSTLYIEPTAGGDAVKVIGDRYNPRNLSWSPDGRFLGYDVALQDGSDLRTVSSYALDDGRSGYVVAPGSLAGSVTDIRFAPGGVRVAYRVDGIWTTRGGPGTFPTAFPRDASPEAFIWMDANRIAARYAEGAGVLDLDAGTTAEWVQDAWLVLPALAAE